MKRKRAVLAVCALFAAVSVFGQGAGSVPESSSAAGVQSSGGVLTKAGFGKFAIGGQKFSFREAGGYLDDRYTAHMLRDGAIKQWVALGFGVPGAAFIATGFVLFFGMDVPSQILFPTSWVGLAMRSRVLSCGA